MQINLEADTAHPRLDGTCRLRLTIYHNRKYHRWSFPFHIEAKAWRKDRKRVKFGAKDSTYQNDFIDNVMSTARRALDAGKSIDQVFRMLSHPEQPESTLLSEVLTQHCEAHKKRLSYGTMKGRRTIIADVEQAIPLVSLEGLSSADILKLDGYYMDRKLAQNTRRSRLKRLRTMYRRSCKERGIEPKDIFEGLIPAEVRSIKQFLTLPQIERLRTAQMPTVGLQLAVDSWMLQYELGGLRFGEVCRLRYDMLRDNAFRWIEGKVPKPRYHPVRPQAQAIMDRYKDTGSHVLPLIREGLEGEELSKAIAAANASVNLALKKACKLLDLPPISTHNARHSMAHRIKSLTGDVHAASKILGHSRIADTERYLNELDHSDVDEVFGRL